MSVRIVQEMQEAADLQLPEAVQLSLLELQGSVKEGLMAMAVGTGMAVLDAMLAEQVTALCGPKGKHQPNREARRHSTERSSLPLGGQRVGVRKPRVRSADGERELQLPVWEHFSQSDQLGDVVLERLLAGVSTRRYQRSTEPLGADVVTSSTSKSAVSRSFVKRTERAYEELMGRDLSGEHFVVLMFDGIEIADQVCVAALGITIDGTKRPLGLWQGSTENHSVAGHLIADLDRRGLDVSAGVLVVLDGGKGIAKAVRDHFGCDALVQRCQRHKERNVLDHVPQDDRPWLRTRLRAAWATADVARAVEKLNKLAAELDTAHPHAAASLREGLEQTVTINRLGLVGTAIARTLCSTNPIESMISECRTRSRNVKRWRNGNMRVRWTAAGMLDVEKAWRRARGYRDLPKLASALRRELGKIANVTNPEAQAA